MLDTAANRRDQIHVFGTDYDTPDGTCIRDYIHVTDLADAHILALNYLLDGGESQFLNLGNNQGFSVREVIAAAKQITGRDINVVEAARRPGDPAQLISDSSLAEKTLDWSPQRSGIDVQIEDAWRWHAKYFQHN